MEEEKEAKGKNVRGRVEAGLDDRTIKKISMNWGKNTENIILMEKEDVDWVQTHTHKKAKHQPKKKTTDTERKSSSCDRKKSRKWSDPGENGSDVSRKCVFRVKM